MEKFDYGMIVIGGGAAGLTSSIWSANLGIKTLIVEKEKKLGGDCLHYGCVPSKSLIKSAYVYHLMKKSQEFGLPKSDLKPVDFKKIRERIQKIIATIQKNDSPKFFKSQYNIDTKFGSPKFIDKHTISLNGKKITSKKFIIATGSSPRIFPIEGLSEVNYITNIDIFSLDKLPESMIVMGGGPIGVEMAQAFNRLGSKVTIVETMDCVLSKEDKDVSCYVHKLLEEEGLRFETNAKGKKAEQSDDTIKLTIERMDGSKKTIKAKALLVATGRAPNVEGLDLEKADVAYDRGGVKVNKYLQTSQKNIFACGDCNGGFQFTHVAEYEARIASLNAKLPFSILKTDFSSIAWCTYTDPEVASVGLNETMAKKSGIEYDLYKHEFTHLDRALAEGETKGFIKILTNKKKKLIGVQMVGLHAGELIHEWVPIINSKMDIGKIEKTIHIYPTLAQINKKVSGNYLANQSSLIKIATYLFK